MTDGPPPDHPQSAVPTVVLAAHGSLLDGASAEPTFAHADALRELGFDVRTAFWKEQPTIRRVLDTVEGSATVVPLLTSEGYFARQVFPRELGLSDEGDAADASPVTGGTPDPSSVDYLAPVGTHPRMTDVLAGLATDAAASADAPPAEIGVALLGHGSERVSGSGGVTRQHVERLRARQQFASVDAVFLDQEPNVAEIFEHVAAETVVVVPFFIAEGHHVTHDVPAAIGLPASYNPGDGLTPVGDREVAVTHAAGTDERVVEVIGDRLAAAGVDSAVNPAEPTNPTRANATFRRWIATDPSGSRRWGELSISVAGSGEFRRYALRHHADSDASSASLKRLSGPASLRDHARHDDAGRYRALRSERSLPTGWYLSDLTGTELVDAVRAVYPASIAHWYQERQDDLDVTGFEAAAARHTGIYKELDGATPEERQAAIGACCENCVKRRTWDRSAEEGDTGEIPCPEPCPALLEAVRSGVSEDDPRESIREVVA